MDQFLTDRTIWILAQPPPIQVYSEAFMPSQQLCNVKVNFIVLLCGQHFNVRFVNRSSCLATFAAIHSILYFLLIYNNINCYI